MGIGTSHSPQLSIPWTKWDLLREKDATDRRLDYKALLELARQNKPKMEQELTAEKWQQRYDSCQKAIGLLGDMLRRSDADAAVVLGDDQHEQFHDDNMPMFAVYHGRLLEVMRNSDRNPAAWKVAEEEGWVKTAKEYQAAWELAEHLIRSLVSDEFDVARSSRLREGIGVGHAFSFLYRRLWPGGTLPLAPVMLNTYYPPNQPTPKRCYALGQALRRAIESWDGDKRVVVIASGGLSHVVIDEDLDRLTIEALLRKDRDRLCSLPREKLCGGTSEILNWVALAGAMEPMDMKLLDYVTTYRSPAGTGCGMAFAYWTC